MTKEEFYKHSWRTGDVVLLNDDKKYNVLSVDLMRARVYIQFNEEYVWMASQMICRHLRNGVVVDMSHDEYARINFLEFENEQMRKEMDKYDKHTIGQMQYEINRLIQKNKALTAENNEFKKYKKQVKSLENEVKALKANYVTKKMTMAIARINAAMKDSLELTPVIERYNSKLEEVKNGFDNLMNLINIDNNSTDDHTDEWYDVYYKLTGNYNVKQKYDEKGIGHISFEKMVERACDWAMDNHETEGWTFYDSAIVELEQRIMEGGKY